MRIATYYPWIYLTSGVERTIVEMVRRSRHEHTIFTNHFEPQNTYPEMRGLPVVELRRVPVERSMSAVLRASATVAFQRLDLSGHDLLFVHSDGIGDFVLRGKPGKCPAVCFCHTPLRPVFDPYYRNQAMQRRTGVRRLALHLFSTAFKLADRRLWTLYNYVFFNSAETRNRAQHGGLLASLRERHEVLHPGIDWDECRPTWRYEPYFLVAGRIMWTKNLETAIDAFIKFKNISADHEKFRLVIAGQVDTKSASYLRRLRELASDRNDIEFVLSPDDVALRQLFADCYALLFPAFNEDWGIVPLEANAFGKPVIASDRGGPRESILDGKRAF